MFKKDNSRSAALFDIRLKYLDRDVLIIKGSPEEANAVLLSGKIVLSLLEPLHVKRLTLKLFATLRLNWTDTITTTLGGQVARPINHEKRLLEIVWDDFEMDGTPNTVGDVGSGAVSGIITPARFGTSPAQHSASSGSLLARSKSPGSHAGTHGQLSRGNHEFPFSAIIDGSIPESVEGLPGGSLVYRLLAKLDTGSRFGTALVARKHVRVVRTVATDAIELSESVSVDNTWPKKVEYSLSMPLRAVAIGSSVPVHMLLVPLAKNLQPGDIHMALVEYYSYSGLYGPVCTRERVVCERHMAREDVQRHCLDDRWEIDTLLNVPASLTRVTQDCSIATHIKVRHKLKFNIGLINPEGHTSELRASIPLTLFISPFVAISAKQEPTPGLGDNIGGVHVEDDEEEVLFAIDDEGTVGDVTHHLAGGSSATSLTSHSQGMLAPPVYNHHIYDRLWSDVSPGESPLTSGAVTPNRDAFLAMGMSPMDGATSLQLTESLRQLHLQRQENPLAGLSFAARSRSGVFTLDHDDDESGDSAPQTPNEPHRLRPSFGMEFQARPALLSPTPRPTGDPVAFSSSPGIDLPPLLLSLLMVSPVQHLSRSNSTKDWNAAVLSRVPSYTAALRAELPETVLTPVYEPPAPGLSFFNIARELERTNSAALSRNTSAANLPSRGLAGVGHLVKSLSSLNLRGMRGLTGLGSSHTSPVHSTNTSSSNLLAMGLSAPSAHPGRQTPINPMGGSGSGGMAPTTNDSLSPSHRSKSSLGLSFLHRK